MNLLFALLGIIGTGVFASATGTKAHGSGSGPTGAKAKGHLKAAAEEDTSSDGTALLADDPALAVVDPVPEAPQQVGSDGAGGGTEAVTLTEARLDVIGGRVTTLSPAGDDVVSVEILSDPAHGTLSVNPDQSLALVLTRTDFQGTDSLSYRVTHADGSTTDHVQEISVLDGPQDAGWGTGESHYMLATDADGHVVVEHGDNHVTVYASNSGAAWSLQDIATAEGMNVEDVTGKWLAENGTYGFSEDMALKDDAALDLWRAVTPHWSETSNWLLMEKGYSYSFEKPLLEWGMSGESLMHPVYIGSWGEGDAPVLENSAIRATEGVQKVVLQGLEFSEGVNAYKIDDILFDDCRFSGFVSQLGSGVTIRDSGFYDYVRDEPVDVDGDGFWDKTTGAALSGIYVNDTDGFLMEGNFFDHIGWADDYRLDGSIEGGQPPIWFSHNMYIDALMTDVTIRDTISMRSALDAMNLRSGGYVEDFVSIGNNTGALNYGGDYYGYGAVGNYLFMADTLTTDAGLRQSHLNGGYANGLEDAGNLSTLLDNLVVHLADPDAPLPDGSHTGVALKTDSPYYDDTIVYNWVAQLDQVLGGGDRNTEGLDPAAMDATTIQNFTQALLGDPNATIDDLAALLRAQYDGTIPDIVDADMILAYFQQGFGIADDLRSEAQTLTFVPDDLADGVRWDNRINWSTEDLPGTVAGDDVNLNGNDVVHGSNTTIGELDFGDGGRLTAYGGKLTATEGMTAGPSGAQLVIERAGQVWTEGSDGSDIEMDVSGGRFANTGQMSGADLTQTGGQAILAAGDAEYDLGAGHALAIDGSQGQTGFDGDDGGLAVLDAHAGARFDFAADAEGFGTIEEFRSGAFGDAPDVASGIDLGGATLSLDLVGLDAAAGTSFTLMEADEITGLLEVALGDVQGLAGRDAQIVIDYVSDTVSLELSTGSGKVGVRTVGEETMVTSGSEAIWQALTEGQDILPETMTAAEEDAWLEAAE